MPSRATTRTKIIHISVPSEEVFLKQWRGFEVPAKDLYNDYRDFCMEHSLPSVNSAIALGKLLMRGYTQYFTKKTTKAAAVYSSLLRDGGGDGSE